MTVIVQGSAKISKKPRAEKVWGAENEAKALPYTYILKVPPQ